MANKVKYTEPVGFFPEEIRRKCKIGEFYEPKNEEKKPEKKSEKKIENKKK